jgi:hypothetical protein
VVGGWCVAVGVGVVVNGPEGDAVEVDVVVGDPGGDDVAGQDMVDQFRSAPIDPAVPVGFGDAAGDTVCPGQWGSGCGL